MSISSRFLTASALAGSILAVGAASASAAYSFAPPATPFTGSGLNNQTFKFGATGPTWTCTTSSFSGTTGPTGQAWTDFTPSFTGTGSSGSCPAGPLGNVSVTVSGSWRLNVVSGGPSPAAYAATVGINSGSTMVIKPLTVPTCTVTVSSAGNSALTGFSAVNTASPTGIRLYGTISGIQYTASLGCPGIAAGTRSDMLYTTGGEATAGGVKLAGITISGP